MLCTRKEIMVSAVISIIFRASTTKMYTQNSNHRLQYVQFQTQVPKTTTEVFGSGGKCPTVPR